ncbi:MAG TPA: hypothetical protein VGR78_00585 [Verrucomicrobiae bacterium]|nr:hypothetical protein [Verrucomicrobiae bacterium]
MKKQSIETITPAVHLEFIQNQAAAPDLDNSGGLEQIESYHRSLFLHHHAADLERFQQQARIHEDRLDHLETRLKDAHNRLAGTDKLVPVNIDGEPDIKPASPWNWWDRAMFGAGFIAILSLLAFGVLNISFNLLESGLVTFVENPIRAYFWAALLPVGALAVKVGWDFLQSRRARDIYLWSCLATGIAGVLVWVAAYASVYPTLSKSISEHIDSLSVFDKAGGPVGATAAGAKWVDALTVGGQAIAEIFLSAVLGIYMTVIYGRHRPVRLAGNPLFTQLDEERRSLEDGVARERLALAEAKGNQNRLEHQLAALVAFARSMFQKETALRRDQGQQKQKLLDELSDHLRSQLETLGNGATIRNGGRDYSSPVSSLESTK